MITWNLTFSILGSRIMNEEMRLSILERKVKKFTNLMGILITTSSGALVFSVACMLQDLKLC